MPKDIEEYGRKRDFRRTPEPPPKRRKDAKREPQTYVVHRHEARRLHYDLRLRVDGVLKSWAVPRGFSYDPRDKHLAVRTEDHPLEYETFHGVIPKGQYGAGTMTIWDSGRYEVLAGGEPGQGIAAGKLELVLRGRRLRGEWHMVRTDPEKDEWLLFKGRDRYSLQKEEGAGAVDYGAARASGFPRKLGFMKPARAEAPFSDPAWLFEMMFEGIRVFAGKEGDRVWIRGGQGEKTGGELKLVTQDLGRLRAENAVLDGVLVCLDEGERPSRQLLEERLARGAESGIQLYLFDLVYCEEFSLKDVPLAERKRALAAILPPSRALLFVDHVVGEGEKLARIVADSGLSGVLAKKADSAYRSGASAEWREVLVQSLKAADTPLREALESHPDRRRIQYTNLKKVLFPEDGYTKGEFLEYYEAVSETLVPYLIDRPLHMNRFPDGVHGKSFYQKNAPEHLPDWIPTRDIPSEGKSESIRYILCNDRPTLMVLANLGSIDLHPWMSRIQDLDSPDWAVLDLDPKDAPFSDVVKIARTLGKVLRGIGLRPLLKTSGKTGLHVYVPLVEGYSYEHSRMFCEGVARYVAREHSDVATVERVVGQREGKVYVDYLQNHRGQTVVPPYVVRPVDGAHVSAPLDWDELDSALSPSLFHIKNMPARLAQLGDLFQGALYDRQDLLPAITRLQELLASG